MNLGAPELLIILLVILVLFGSTKLPKLARSLGQAQKEFKDGQAEANASSSAASMTPPPPPAQPVQPVQPVQTETPEGPIS